jgi:hypothetical protein
VYILEVIHWILGHIASVEVFLPIGPYKGFQIVYEENMDDGAVTLSQMDILMQASIFNSYFKICNIKFEHAW